MPLPLLRLPRELRDMIYPHALAAPDRPDYPIGYRISKHAPDIVPGIALLRANKQVYKEAV